MSVISSLLRWTVRLFAKGINHQIWRVERWFKINICKIQCYIEHKLLHCLWNNIFQHVFKSEESLYIPSKFHYLRDGYIIKDDVEPEGTISVTFKSMTYTHQRKISTAMNWIVWMHCIILIAIFVSSELGQDLKATWRNAVQLLVISERSRSERSERVHFNLNWLECYLA